MKKAVYMLILLFGYGWVHGQVPAELEFTSAPPVTQNTVIEAGRKITLKPNFRYAAQINKSLTLRIAGHTIETVDLTFKLNGAHSLLNPNKVSSKTYYKNLSVEKITGPYVRFKTDNQATTFRTETGQGNELIISVPSTFPTQQVLVFRSYHTGILEPGINIHYSEYYDNSTANFTNVNGRKELNITGGMGCFIVFPGMTFSQLIANDVVI